MGEKCFGNSMSCNPVQLEAEMWGALFERLS